MISLSTFKQCLNIFTVGMCGFAKVPQIRQLIAVKSTKGLSFLNLAIELFCWSITFSYFTFHGYAKTDFMEYPLLLLQQLLVIILHFHLNKTLSNLGIGAFLVVYFLTLYYWTLGPAWFLQILININPPISSFGKLCQIYEIVKTKTGDNVSKLPFISNSMTSSARFITVMIETQDINLCVGYGLSVVLNFAVAITAWIYSTGKKSD